MGVSLRLNPIVWANNLTELNAGNIDCIWSTLSITNDRKENMFFGKAYMNNKVVVTVPSTSNVKNISDLEGKIVGILAASPHIVLFQVNSVYSKVKSVVERPNISELFNELKTGKIDALIMDEHMVKYWISHN